MSETTSTPQPAEPVEPVDVPVFTDVPGPAHPHDCPAVCVYLGSIAAVPGVTPPGVAAEDLYVHPRSPRPASDLVHRFGADGEYGSVDVKMLQYFEPGSAAKVVYAEIYRRAVERDVW